MTHINEKKKKTRLDALQSIVGEKNIRREMSDKLPHLTEPRGVWHGSACAVVMPRSTNEVVRIVEVARQHGLHLVPQGGGTGLVGGQIPFDEERALVVNFSRMNKVREKNNHYLIAEAGCVLASIHETAASLNQQFPLRLASEGSAQIGGLLATNAGGHHVLRYGMMRNLTLGLEVVFADGSVWNGLRAVPKDNTGYDLKNLLIGSEGTLGLITAAVLQLYPRERESAVAMVALPSIEHAVALFARAQAVAFGRLSAFELIAHRGMAFMLRHFTTARLPFAQPHPYYLLIETADPAILESLLEKEEAVVASTPTQAQALWFLRENLSEVQKKEGASIKHDISVPLPAWSAFAQETFASIEQAVAGTRPVVFGHLGDGNLHFNLSRPEKMSDEDFLAQRALLNKIVYDQVLAKGGSISAEHGIGILKQQELEQQQGSAAMTAMRAIKKALDPDNILNPDKIFL